MNAAERIYVGLQREALDDNDPPSPTAKPKRGSHRMRP